MYNYPKGFHSTNQFLNKLNFNVAFILLLINFYKTVVFYFLFNNIKYMLQNELTILRIHKIRKK